jgi:hypothetical protein
MTQRSILTAFVLTVACSTSGGADADTDTSTGTGDTSTSPTTTTASTTTVTTSTTTTADTSTSDPETSSGTTFVAECELSLDCTDPLLPICIDGTCVACTDSDDGDAACEDANADTPVCGDDGACVQCTTKSPAACGDTTPICDAATSTCVGCTFHEQCEDACDIATGACFSGDCVVDVDGSTTISASIGDGCVLRIAELAGDASYEENLVLLGNTVALIAVEGSTPTIEGEAGMPTIWITGGANVYLQGLRVVGFADRGVEITDASAWIDRTTVAGINGGGIELSNDAYASIRNSFATGGIDTTTIYAASSSLDLTYSTIIGGFGTGRALECTPVGTINVRNSILLAAGDSPEVGCATEVFEDNVTEIEVGDFDPDWFEDANNIDYHLTPTAPIAIIDAAQWQPGDPLVDIDGDPRPGIRNAADVAGADVP